MFATNHSQGNLSAGMPTSPEMDALFDAFQAAESEDDQREIMGKIQAEWNELVPALVFAPSAEFLMWSKQVHGVVDRSEEHTSELQSLMRISYAVFCLKQKKKQLQQHHIS